MADYNRFDPMKYTSGRLDYSDLQRFREIVERSSEQKRPREEKRSFTVCGCGDPRCNYSPPETQEAARRGEIPASVLDEMRNRARNRMSDAPFTVSGGEESRAGPSPKPDNFKELREAVAKWIIEAPAQRFSDIIGNEAALSELRDAIRAPIEQAELYSLYGMSMPKGALLSGPPGCGKTMFARAAASEMQELYGTKEMISISGSELQAPFVGVTEGYIKSIFAYARAYKQHHGHPLLVFIDEAEVLFPDRSGRVRKVASWEESQVATFLAEMDGIQASGAFVLLATNRPEVIDSAVLRDGRCDFKIRVERPTQEAIEGILRKTFTGIFTNETEEALVFAAVEAIYAPHRVLLDFHDLVTQMEDFFRVRGFEPKDPKSLAILRTMKLQRFTFDMIVSGAMAASIPARAKRKAFARDSANGTKTGVCTADVLAAVDGLFEENKNLEHDYAMREFIAKVEEELKIIGDQA